MTTCPPCTRYEDNFDAVNNLAVIVQSVGKDNIEQLGSPDKFLSVSTPLPFLSTPLPRPASLRCPPPPAAAPPDAPGSG